MGGRDTEGEKGGKGRENKGKGMNIASKVISKSPRLCLAGSIAELTTTQIYVCESVNALQLVHS